MVLFSETTEAFAQRGSVKNVLLEISQNPNLCQSLFFKKVAGLRLTTLFKKGFGTGVLL